MSSSKANQFRKSENGKYQCLLCDKELATKQRVLSHLFTKHRQSPIKRLKKRYLEDENIPVPRSTLYYRQKKSRKGSHMFYSDTGSDDADTVSSSTETEEKEQNSTFPVTEESDTSLKEESCELQDITNVMASISNRQDANDKGSSSIPNSALILPSLDSELDSGSDNDRMNSDLSDHTLSDMDSSSSYLSISTSCESEDSEDDNVTNNGKNSADLLTKDFQALSLLSCFLRNKFSDSACKDVITTLKETFVCEEISCLNYSEILSQVDMSPLHEIHYCILCHTIFPEDRDIFRCMNPNCNGLRYKGTLAAQSNKARQPAQMFVFADVKAQLVALLETPGVWKNIQETKSAAFDRFESGSTVITDIMDGSSYRALMVDGGFLDKTSPNLTAVFNTDGVNLFSSSKIDLWPIFLAINELSPPKRFARENIILAGLWQGKGKPPFSEFFKVFADQMNSLYTDGVQILIDSESLNVRLSALCCIADLPAKAELLNMSYFNGPHACIKCEESGITVKQGKGSAKCYPYKVLGNRSSACTDESVRHHMALGIPNKRSYGFKGVSALSDLQNYNIVEGAVPEYMHGVLLGVTKTLMTKWFSASESKKDYFIGQHLKEVSNMMRNLKPPEGIERLPRDLEKHYNHFKATELQSWLLYYGFPCVREFLGDEYLENFSHLSEAVHILLRDYITREELAVATDLLDQFYASFQRLYGDGSCGLNVHNIGCHLPEYVRLWGPLWAWSAFPFEDANATLLQAVHGTGTVLKQLIKYRQAQSYIRRKGLDLRNTVSRKITLKTCNCDIAGAAKPVKPNEIEDEVMEQMEIVPDDLCKLKKVDRVIVNENIFYSKQYTRMKRRICSVVLYGNKEIGSIQYFILCENLVYAVIKKMDQLPASQIPGARVANHYTAVRSTDVLSVVDVVELKKVLVYLNTTGNENAVDTAGSLPYVVSMPNKYGHAVFK